MTETATGTQSRYLTYIEASELTALSRWTLHRAVERGELHAIKVGSAVRFERADLEAFMKSHKR